MAFVVVLDACVLVPHPLFDTLLRVAHAGLYECRWSQQILADVERTLVERLSQPPDRARRRISAMRDAFPHAEVEGHEQPIDAMRNDPKDRHVLAAAVRAGASAVVTANLKDFPPAALQPYGVEPVHPDDFLLDLLDLDEPTVLQVLVEQSQAYLDPPVPLDRLLRQLVPTTPRFAAEVAAAVAR